MFQTFQGSNISATDARKLADSLAEQFTKTGSKERLNEAIRLYQKAVDLSLPEDVNRINHLVNLGLALQHRAQLTDVMSMEDLGMSITCYKKAIDDMEAGDSEVPGILDKLGCALRTKYESAGDIGNLDASIAAHRRAVEVTSVDDPERGAYLNNLGIALQNRLDIEPSQGTLEEAFKALKDAVQSTSTSNPNRPMYLNNLAGVYLVNYDITGSIEDLNGAVRWYEEASATSAEDDVQRGMFLNNFGSVLRTRHTHTGSDEDWIRGIRYAEEAVELTPPEHPGRASRLINFASVLQTEFEKTGDANVLDRAIALCKESMQLTPKGHHKRALRLNILSDGLRLRFDKTGSADDLNNSIAASEEAVKSSLTPRPENLNNYALCLLRRFQRLGRQKDLNDAVRLLNMALNIVNENDRQRPLYLVNLGNALRTRFERVGSTEDLQLAIEKLGDGIETLQPHDNFNRAMLLSSLGSTLRGAFERNRDLQNLNEAIVAYEEATRLLPEEAFYRSEYLNSLASALSLRASVTESTQNWKSDLDRAIALAEESLSLLSEDSPDRPSRYNVLGNSLRLRYDKTGSKEDLNSAVASFEKAVNCTAPDHLDRARNLSNLASALAERNDGETDLIRALEAFEQSANIPFAPPTVRILAAVRAARLAVNEKSNKTSQLFKTAVELLPSASPASLNLLDQEVAVSRFAGLTSEAVAVMLHQGIEVNEVVRLIELGRGVIIGRILDLRSELQGLPNDLAEEYENIRATLDPQMQLSQSALERTRTAHPSDRHAAELELVSLIAKIRQQAGFETFLLGPSESELKTLAQSGSIVIFNVSGMRSDAFLITETKIQSLELPLLRFVDLEASVRRFLDAINNQSLPNYRFAKEQVNKVLEWLWDVAVCPILEKLEITQNPVHWPRVWWIPNGLLNILPIHAAGYHNSKPSQTALDCVISSYAPSVKSLLRARQRAKTVECIQQQNAIIVGMPETPEHPINLPFVKDEINEVTKLLSRCPAINSVVMQNPTRDQVLSALPKQQIVHLACHGFSADNPLRSSLLLNDWQTTPFTVSDIISLSIESAGFAYLSACHTSRIKEFTLLDESISLSSSIQLSGYPSVVGTLWEVMDSDSVQVAKDVYRYMLNGGMGGKLNTENSAEGLHWAVRALRDKTRTASVLSKTVPTDPLVWATYIHIGV